MHRINLETYTTRRRDDIVAAYNRLTEQEPHAARLTSARFEEIVEAKPWFDPGGLFLAVKSGEVTGWIHACVASGTEPWNDHTSTSGYISMLLFDPDDLDTGRLLVESATGWLRSRCAGTLDGMNALNGYPLYRGIWMGGEPLGLSTTPHVQMALATGGYRTVLESVFFAASITAPPEADRRVDGMIAQEREALMANHVMRASWQGFRPRQTDAMLDGNVVGTIRWVIIPDSVAKLGAPCLNIWGLWVDDAHRRRGIASYLTSCALSSAYASRARFATVDTQLDNGPAQAVYYRAGFRPHRLMIGRQLAQGSP